MHDLDLYIQLRCHKNAWMYAHQAQQLEQGMA